VTRKAYSSDLTKKQYKRLEALIPPAKLGGAPRTVEMYEILCGIMYVLRNACVWRDLPHDLPPWQTVYAYFRRFQKDGSWPAINRKLVREVRKAAGREPEPSAAIMDAQSVRTTPQGGIRGVDAGKQTHGRKRHVLVDSLGLLLLVLVTAASVQDRDGGKLLLNKARLRFPRLRLIWADGGYAGQLVLWAAQVCGWVVEIIKRCDTTKGFVVLPRRWVVERSLAWFTRCRRLVRDFETLPDVTEAWIYLASIQLLLRRLDPS